NAAEIAYTEYVDGTFLQEEQTILGEIFVAEESLSRSVQYARYSQRLAAKHPQAGANSENAQTQ
ncbi:MAG: hypothetical protein NXI22_12805, partial [bacterium]|nr:hypothetical protein [bacterium]